MYVVDASVWVSRYVIQEKDHAVSEAWIERQLSDSRDLIGPALVLGEIGGAVAQRTQDGDLGLLAMTEVEALEGIRIVSPDWDMWWRSGNIAATLRLPGSDSLYIALADFLNMPLVTWDDQQRSRGSNIVIATTPAELLSERRR
jgi:predicted nucleic acid-binding protein